MKSYNHLFEQYISDENIKLAIKNVCKHKLKRKRFRDLHDNPEKYMDWIRANAIDYHNSRHIPVEIYDGIQRKKRTIIVPSFREQIIHHMMINVLKPIFMKSMYEHSYGSIPGRGGTLGMKRIRKWLDKDHKNTKYCLKMDIKKYFDSVPHDVVLEKLSKQIHDEKFLKILKEVVDVNEKGLPLGFYTSQWFANWYLTEMDHYIKEELGAKYYIRYMDDMIIFGANKRKLHKMRIAIDNYLQTRLKLRLKENWQIFPINSRFLDFMGYRFYRDRTTLRRSILYKACRKSEKIAKEKATIYEIKQAMSYLGWFKQTNTYDIFKKRFCNDINIQNMKRRISRYDKRMAKLSGGLQTSRVICQR